MDEDAFHGRKKDVFERRVHNLVRNVNKKKTIVICAQNRFEDNYNCSFIKIFKKSESLCCRTRGNPFRCLTKEKKTGIMLMNVSFCEDL